MKPSKEEISDHLLAGGVVRWGAWSAYLYDDMVYGACYYEHCCEIGPDTIEEFLDSWYDGYDFELLELT